VLSCGTLYNSVQGGFILSVWMKSSSVTIQPSSAVIRLAFFFGIFLLLPSWPIRTRSFNMLLSLKDKIPVPELRSGNDPSNEGAICVTSTQKRLPLESLRLFPLKQHNTLLESFGRSKSHIIITLPLKKSTSLPLKTAQYTTGKFWTIKISYYHYK